MIHILLMGEILAIQRGELSKECLRFVQNVWQRGGGTVNFLCGRGGGYGSFLEQPHLHSAQNVNLTFLVDRWVKSVST